MKTSSQFIVSEKTHYLYGASLSSNIAQLLVAYFFYGFYQAVLASSFFDYWFYCALFFLGGRIGIYFVYKRWKGSYQDRHWLNLYIGLSACVGCVWAWLLLWYGEIPDAELPFFLLILSIGLMSAGVSSLMSSKLAFIAYSLPQMIALYLIAFRYHGEVGHFIASVFTVYFFIILTLIKKTNENLVSSLILREKNESLVASLNDEIDQRQTLIQNKTRALTSTNQQLKTSEARLNSIIDSSPVGIIYFDLDSHTLMINKRLENILGVPRAKLIGFNIIEGLKNQQIKQAVESALAGEMGIYHGEYPSEKSGQKLFLHAEFVPVFSEAHEVIGGIGVFDDFTDKQQATETLTKLSRVVECSPHSVIITDVDGLIEYVNPTFSLLTGYDAEEVLGQRVIRYQFSSLALEEHKVLINSIREGREWNGVLEHTRKDGSVYWAQTHIAPIKDEQNQVTHFVGIQEDITDAKKASDKLTYQASHDELTGLINRYAFERKLQSAIKSAKHENTRHALCFLDLDQFKIINDTCGHIAGDELLRQLGVGLTNNIRQSDTLARLGGDEFAILLEYCNIKQALKTANNIRAYIDDFKFAWQEHVFNVGVSIGVAEISDQTANATEVLIHADSACYAAKDLGRNRVHFYAADDEQLAKRDGEFRWVQKINEALLDDKFVLFAQPIQPINGTDNGKIFEILVRYQDDNGQLVPPGAFLPAAERYNLSGRVDRWVVDNVIQWLKDSSDDLDKLDHLAINLSGNSLGDDAILGHIVKEIRSSGVPPSKIKFEITETAAISNLIDAQMFIGTLRDIGCAFALDDFGSGLSSFGYLKNLPVDTLKIDGMFVRDILDDEIDQAMVKSINDIGHVMGKKTVAEFVENQAIVERLIELGVDYAQGYHIGKPEPLSGVALSTVGKASLNLIQAS
jgi:diguanylate cyclase (GGDEF)-like protein/PAS domain S-box-containing protein